MEKPVNTEAMIREDFAHERAKEDAEHAAMPAQAVRAKPLEWTAEGNGEFIAVSQVGWYHIGFPCKSWNLTMPSGEVPSFGDDLEAAKAAAQADYEARILSALTPAPDLASENERLRAALERQGDNIAFVINHVTLPEQWLTKFMVELAEDRAALERT